MDFFWGGGAVNKNKNFSYILGIVIEAIFSLLQFTFFWLIINIFLSNVLILISEILLFQEPINHELTMKPCNSCHKCCILIKKFV